MTHIFFKQIIKTGMVALTLSTTALASQSVSAESGQKFPTTTLTAGMHVIQAEVAATPDQREQGLMFRKKMAQNEGMIFLFRSEEHTSELQSLMRISYAVFCL